MKDIDPIGFYWCTDDTYNIVILDKSRRIKVPGQKGKTVFCWEHAAPTPEALVETCAYGDGEIGYHIGSVKDVKRLCESKPHRSIKRTVLK